MAYAQEVRLNSLPDDVSEHVRKLFEIWQAAHRGDALPDRHALNCDKLGPWVDDIGVYEYLPESRDFVIRVDAATMIDASGTNYKGCSPRQIDLDYGTALMATLLEVIETKQPVFHIIGVTRKVWEEWVRLLLPVQTFDGSGKVILQIFVVHFIYRGP